MPKSALPLNADARPGLADAPSSSGASTPWALQVHAAQIGIDAFVDKAEEWLTIATITPQAAIDAKRVAEQIIRAVNNEERYRQLLDDMAGALEACLSCDGLDFTAEHDGEIALRRYRAATGG